MRARHPLPAAKDIGQAMAARAKTQEADQSLVRHWKTQKVGAAAGRARKPGKVCTQARPLRGAQARVGSKALPGTGELRRQAVSQCGEVNDRHGIDRELQMVAHGTKSVAQARRPAGAVADGEVHRIEGKLLVKAWARGKRVPERGCPEKPGMAEGPQAELAPEDRQRHGACQARQLPDLAQPRRLQSLPLRAVLPGHRPELAAEAAGGLHAGRMELEREPDAVAAAQAAVALAQAAVARPHAPLQAAEVGLEAGPSAGADPGSAPQARS